MVSTFAFFALFLLLIMTALNFKLPGSAGKPVAAATVGGVPRPGESLSV